MNTAVLVDDTTITLKDGLLTIGDNAIPVTNIKRLTKTTRRDAKFFYLVIGFALIASTLHIYLLTSGMMPASVFGMITIDVLLAALVMLLPAHLLANRDLVIDANTGSLHLTGNIGTLKTLSSLLDAARSGQDTGAWHITGGRAQPMQ